MDQRLQSVYLMELPQEYRRQQMLFEIANAVGTPLVLDESTKNRTFGHYARVLVDMDLSCLVFDEIMVERTASLLMDTRDMSKTQKKAGVSKPQLQYVVKAKSTGPGTLDDAKKVEESSKRQRRNCMTLDNVFDEVVECVELTAGTPILSLAKKEASVQQTDGSAVDTKNVDLVPETQPNIEVVSDTQFDEEVQKDI
ncbi:defensin-like protein [Trifolium pratense]|uniref:Defensin-like protein n=1 Tax=Trifolium pratense TaxID=57577 RepID=A0A2K3L7R3_TRIPR|nr:defensin-like protein [Trifolium pratense]